MPGDPEKSLLIKAVRYTDPDLQMPPKNQKLTDAQVADLVAWVKMGAPDPRTANTPGYTKEYAKSERDHWAFKPIKKQPVPEVKAKDWVVNPIDNFIAAKLEESGMKPSPIADKRTLIRRATFDLIGLPPTLKETQDFLADDSADAFAKVVDRLLASPQYGERWGRYWLDTARYSDTKGDVKRNQEDFHYPNAWTYRDYVVRAFNEDKPFNRFIVEQIAADKLTGSDRSNWAAMGFLTIGERFNGKIEDINNDRIDVVTKGFLGLTVTCARCHDHKFDPIPTKDYYSLYGIFASSVEPRDFPVLGTIKMTPDYEDYVRKQLELDKQMQGIAGQRRAAAGGGAAKVKQVRQERIETVRERAQLDMTHPGSPARAMVLNDRPKPADSPVFIRGESENKGDIVPRRFLEILSGPSRPAFHSGSGRLELAGAIASPSNPLTPRVIMNRLWLHHFGEGIVTTPDDFGNQSAPPSHPELLDYLAMKFMDDGWSLKKMHRFIMLSSTYRQSSADNPRYTQMDPNNRLLWHANIRRLEFEAVRDSMLALGGKLDLTMGGRPVNLGASPYSTRRTIYGYVDRRNLPEVYNQFDFANPDISTGKRYETIVPQQALFMMNSPLVVEQARNIVNSSAFKNVSGNEARIKLLYDIIYQREPTDTEIKLGLSFLEDAGPLERPVATTVAAGQRRGPGQRRPQQQQQQQNKRGGAAMTLATIPPGALLPVGNWAKYTHALLQANEAMFIN